MTTAQSLITIGIIALGTVFTRFLPFWLFPKGKPAPLLLFKKNEKIFQKE